MDDAARHLSVRYQALSRERQELFLQLLAEHGLASPDLPILPRPHGRNRVPASSAHERLWLEHRLQPANPAYIIPIAAWLEGDLDVPAFEAALGRVVERHEALRTRFELDDGGPVQVIDPPRPFRLPLADLCALGEEAAGERAAAELRRPFDPAAAAPWRASLLRCGPRSHLLLIVLHHLVADEWSVGVLLGELAEIYRALRAGRSPRLPELPVQYADFSEWQRQWLSRERIEALLRAFRPRLEPLPQPLRLGGGERPRWEGAGATHAFHLDAELTHGLHRLARDRGATLFMLLLAAFECLLAAYAGQEELTVGTDFAGRERAEVEPLIGFFVNQWVLRCDLRHDPPFLDHLARVREGVLEALAYQSLPFQHLAEALRPPHTPPGFVPFRAKFVLQERAVEPGDLGDLGWRPLDLETGGFKFELLLNMQQQGGRLWGQFEYSRELFDASDIRFLGDQLERLLRRLLEEPAVRQRQLAQGMRDAGERWREAESEALRERRASRLLAAQRRADRPG